VTPKNQKTENENLDAIELGKRCLFRQLEFVFSGKLEHHLTIDSPVKASHHFFDVEEKLLKKKEKLLPTRLYDDDDDYGENKKINCSDAFDFAVSSSFSPPFAIQERIFTDENLG
jgi:hypothetical protein